MEWLLFAGVCFLLAKFVGSRNDEKEALKRERNELLDEVREFRKELNSGKENKFTNKDTKTINDLYKRK